MGVVAGALMLLSLLLLTSCTFCRKQNIRTKGGEEWQQPKKDVSVCVALNKLKGGKYHPHFKQGT